jgi:hypothetical protein
MDTSPRRSLVEVLKHRASGAISRTNILLQTPLGSAIGGGLVVVLIAHYVFGIG